MFDRTAVGTVELGAARSGQAQNLQRTLEGQIGGAGNTSSHSHLFFYVKVTTEE